MIAIHYCEMYIQRRTCFGSVQGDDHEFCLLEQNLEVLLSTVKENNPKKGCLSYFSIVVMRHHN